jgi:hypothetical protein
MTETQTPAPRPPMPVGGTVMAIVPQNFLEIQQVANQIITAGVAPSALVQSWVPDDATDDERLAIAKRNTSAVSTAIMAGLEVGLPPMAALRMFTVINGRPALYADGNVAVVRKAKDSDGKRIAEYVKAGTVLIFDLGCPYCEKKRKTEEDLRTHIKHAHPDEDPTEPGTEILSDRTFGWCEAKRADTGEVMREEFTIADAKRARLWDERDQVEREVWEKPAGGGRRQKVKRVVENDAPWHRFWQRMLMWRPTGYCLRWLFADVLGGMPDEYEARDMVTIDIVPNEPRQRPRVEQVEPPSPPPPPDQPPETQKDEDDESQPQTGADLDDEEFLGALEYWLDQETSLEDVNKVIEEMDPLGRFPDDDDLSSRARAIINTARTRVTPLEAPAADGDLLAGGEQA